MSQAKNLVSRPLVCIILAAGQGTRMRSDRPKVLHPVAGQPMIAHVIRACVAAAATKIVCVLAPAMQTVRDVVAPHVSVTQAEPRGTGDAVKAAREVLADFHGDVMVLFGDTPLITPEALQKMRAGKASSGAALVVAGFTPEDPAQYGRLVVNAAGQLEAIVEAADATPEQRALKLCNGGVMLFEADKLWGLLDELKPNNAKREYYLTDCVTMARQQGWGCAVVELLPTEVLGVNTREELAQAEKLKQQSLRQKAMANGATLLDPDTVYFADDTRLGRDVTIEPNVFFGAGVEIGDKAVVRAFSYLEQVRVETGAVVGPFARLRPGSVIGAEAHIGNFVEIKNASVGAGAKINHLSYIGDASVGAKANVGAGTITCNYDGYRKSHTEIGAGSFIGSNTALVAPVSVGEGAYVGAGSVITQNVPANTLAVARGRQANVEDWATRYREEQARSKNDKS